ncbi:unnamed protein product, partial [Adineta steineri]
GTIKGYVLELAGTTSSNDSGVSIAVLMPQNVITTGSYNSLT